MKRGTLQRRNFCHTHGMISDVARVIVFALSGMFVYGVCSADIFDYSVVPRPHENFCEAGFRFVVPDTVSHPNAIVVFIPGTDGDGRGAVTNATFLSISEACHAALIGCHFRGEGLGYDDPSGGSGRALDEAISHFADVAQEPKLTQIPLLLIGYSQGGMFTFNYICWRPERVKAFAALKAIFPKLQPTAAAFSLPGLLAAGQADEPGRIRAIAQAFLGATGKHSEWAFLLERGVGHDLDPKSIGMAGDLFEAVCQEASAERPVYLNAETGNSETVDSTAAGRCWFPNQNVASTWKALHQLIPLQKLISTPNRQKLQDLVTVRSEPEAFSCRNEDRQSGVLDLSGSTTGLIIDRVQIAGDGFNVNSPSRGPLPIEVITSFAPRDLAWGRIRADIEIDGSLNGQSLEPLTVSVAGVVRGAVTASPSSLYLGIVSRGDLVDRKIRLKSNQGPMHLVDIRAPSGITVTSKIEADDEAEVYIHWASGPDLGKISGDILLSFDLPEKGTLKIPVIGLVSN
jgi:predicted esterase